MTLKNDLKNYILDKYGSYEEAYESKGIDCKKIIESIKTDGEVEKKVKQLISFGIKLELRFPHKRDRWENTGIKIQKEINKEQELIHALELPYTESCDFKDKVAKRFEEEYESYYSVGNYNPGFDWVNGNEKYKDLKNNIIQEKKNKMNKI